MGSRSDVDRWLPLVRRVVLAIVAAPFLMAIGMTLVDSYRRRGKHRAVSFPTAPPSTVPVGEGDVTSYSFGTDLYEDMIAAIDGAQRQVLLETYIWKGDDVGLRFKAAVEAAAARGVEVFVIYDAFANLVVSPRFKRFRQPIKVLRYPVYAAGWRPFDLRRYGRDHRKILVVDDTIGFVGGYNIGDAYATEWRDTHVRITGPAVWDLKRAFADFWNLNRRRRFRPSERPLLLETASTWEPTIRLHRNVPRLWMFPIRAMYIEAITRASRNIWLTTAYFLPDPDFAGALMDAARRGVDVRLLIPAKSNHVVSDWISRGYFSQLLDAGVKVLRYRDAMVHAKTATIDGTWATVGTANIDRLSLTGNYEINVEIIDPKLAGALEEAFRVDESNSLELTKAEWEARDMYRRFTEFVLNPLRPLL
ncbi:MAG TPA: phosphatidylserine/phosphatidylglycerophosphate/cardiolipin synthase family protein [Nocardioides sp.]|nr:phosphatidylserine/phosphatidylglycerophosphate/cardiolipin synthase family protein [Nocardioides sp.]